MKDDWDIALYSAGLSLAAMVALLLWVAYEIWR